MKEKTKNIIGKVFNILSIALLVLTAGLLVFVAVSKINNKTPQFFGYSLHFVVTDSMEDEIMVGDLVIGKKTDIMQINEGDDVIFVSTDPSLQGKTIVHRVRRIEDSDGERKLYTYGIKYNKDDDSRYPVTSVIGTVSSVSGFWGRVFNPVGIVLLFVVVLMIFVFYYGLKSLIKGRREIREQAVAEKVDAIKAEILQELMAEKDSLRQTDKESDDSGH